jgi:gamma-glutamyl-gamma-aminobutyrate hydrolase PuuD
MTTVMVVGSDDTLVNYLETFINKVRVGTSPDILQHGDIGLIQFTGGEDVSPHLYGEEPNRFTFSNPDRDRMEAEIYFEALSLGIPMIGVCRGLQFLNVMNGGKMHQDIPFHTKSHTVTAKSCPLGDCHLVEDFPVSSTHHQICIPGEGAAILALASKLSHLQKSSPPLLVEVEALYYEKSRCFGVQYHPEFMREGTRGRSWYEGNVKALLDKCKGIIN